jgi:hypothetical protein
MVTRSLPPLCPAYDDLPHREVQVLHPEMQRLEQPEATAVHEQGDDPRRPGETRQQQPDLVPVQDDRQPHWLLRAWDRGDRLELVVQDLLVEKQQRAQRLGLARGAEGPRLGERREEPGDVGRAELARVAKRMEADVAPDRRDVALLGPGAEVTEADGLADLVQELRGANGSRRLRVRRHGRILGATGGGE